jgi:hypothetical protein
MIQRFHRVWARGARRMPIGAGDGQLVAARRHAQKGEQVRAPPEGRGFLDYQVVEQ